MTSSDRPYGGAAYARVMNAVALVLSIAAGVYLVYAMLYPERF
jgi:K+-transporting ATPase KdpF subunit